MTELYTDYLIYIAENGYITFEEFKNGIYDRTD